MSERPEEDETHKMDRKSSKIASNGKELLRRPRLYQSCSAEQEEEVSWHQSGHFLGRPCIYLSSTSSFTHLSFVN